MDEAARGKLWEEYNRIVKPNGAIIIFSQEPFATYLRMSNIKDYKYDWYWDPVPVGIYLYSNP